MTGYQWLSPLFWLGAALGFFVSTFLTAYFRLAPVWASFVLSFFVGLFVGLRLVGLFLRWRPDARYTSTQKIEGLGYVWSSADVIIPYFILGILTSLFGFASLLIKHFAK